MTPEAIGEIVDMIDRLDGLDDVRRIADLVRTGSRSTS
jgi:hypothetical protein